VTNVIGQGLVMVEPPRRPIWSRTINIHVHTSCTLLNPVSPTVSHSDPKSVRYARAFGNLKVSPNYSLGNGFILAPGWIPRRATEPAARDER
jgi:hypothetical protein